MNHTDDSLAPLAPLPCCFDAIVVTAPNERAARASVIELRVAYSRACLPSATPPVMLAVADPNGARIGSGGGRVAHSPSALPFSSINTRVTFLLHF